MKSALKLFGPLVLIFLFTTLNAQEEKQNRLKAGLGAGINLSKYLPIAGNDYVDPFTPNIGYEFYGIGVYDLGKGFKLKLKPGFTFYSNKAYERNFNIWLSNIPLTLDVNLGKGFSIEGGLDLTAVLNLDDTGDYENITYFVINGYDDQKVFLSGQLGVNYMVSDKLGINLKSCLTLASFFRSFSRAHDPSQSTVTSDTYIVSSDLTVFYLF